MDSIEPPPEPSSDDAPARRGLPRFALGLIGGVVVLAAAAAAGVTVFMLAAGHGTVLDRMVPSGAAAYASLNLDPPADQKLDLLNLSHKLPELDSEQQVDKNLNQMLEPLGLSYTGDVKPWLGAQVVAVGTGATKPEGALLFDSKDDSAAQQALVKLKTGRQGSEATWHEAVHGGVTLEVGSLNGESVVLAYFDHTLLAASSESLAGQIIDTDQGKHPRLDSTAEFRTISGRLPSSRLATLFVDGHGVAGWTNGIFDRISKGLSPGGGLAITPPPIDRSAIGSSLDAFRGAGFALTARPDGLAGDLEMDVDVSKLTPDQRAYYDRPGRAGSELASVPSTAVAVLAISNLDTILKSLPAGLGAGVGISSPQALAQKLTGGAAIEVEPDGRGVGIGAVIGTTDPAGIRALLDSLAGGETGSPLASAISGQSLLIASSPAELARLQAAGSGSSLGTAPAYRQAAGFAVSAPGTILYADADGAFRLADSTGLGGGSELQKQRSEWAAVHSVLITSGGTSLRIHIVIA